MPLQMRPFSILSIQVPISTLEFPVNISINEKVASTHVCDCSKVENARGNQVPPCDTMCQNKSQVSSYIRQFHLGICVACYICDHHWWSATEWKKHMTTHHSNLSEQEYLLAPTEAPTGKMHQKSSKKTCRDTTRNKKSNKAEQKPKPAPIRGKRT